MGECARLATADFEFMNCTVQQISIVKNIVSKELVVSISERQKNTKPNPKPQNPKNFKSKFFCFVILRASNRPCLR